MEVVENRGFTNHSLVFGLRTEKLGVANRRLATVKEVGMQTRTAIHYAPTIILVSVSIATVWFFNKKVKSRLAGYELEGNLSDVTVISATSKGSARSRARSAQIERTLSQMASTVGRPTAPSSSSGNAEGPPSIVGQAPSQQPVAAPVVFSF